MLFQSKEGFDVIKFLDDVEEGQLSEQETIDGFQELINTKMVWQLRGWYRRTANILIDTDRCALPKEKENDCAY